MPFKFIKQRIPELIVIEPLIFYDNRGFFLETFKKSRFKENGIDEEFIQSNHSFSVKNVVRGLHYQLFPNAQGKLVRVLKGKVWDIAVDIRKHSPTFKQWVGVELTEENNKLFYIPRGFAHGFVVLSDSAHFTYDCTAEYSKKDEAGIIWNDQEIGIDWRVNEPILSEKDLSLPSFKDAKIFD
jgi:dTDP-4-dehydrorhamnose 3,5-epimerase